VWPFLAIKIADAVHRVLDEDHSLHALFSPRSAFFYRSVVRANADKVLKNRDNKKSVETNGFISLFIDIGYIYIYIYEMKYSHSVDKIFAPVSEVFRSIC
jgi:hypothetical protein